MTTQKKNPIFVKRFVDIYTMKWNKQNHCIVSLLAFDLLPGCTKKYKNFFSICGEINGCTGNQVIHGFQTW